MSSSSDRIPDPCKAVPNSAVTDGKTDRPIPLEGIINMSIGLACQTITWGDGQVAFMDRVTRVAAEAGYDALEIGFRRLDRVETGAVKKNLERYGLTVLATHIGGNLEDRAQAQSEQSMIDTVIDCVKQYGAHYIMYSGLRYENNLQFSRAVDMINRAARTCAERGVRMLYHNHNWEFDPETRIMDRLLEKRAPELGFCPDVGWIAKGGQDPMAFLETVKDDTPLLHFKDFASLAPPVPPVDTVCLGQGVVPLADVARWIREGRSNVQWIIAEQDRCDGNPDDAVTTNGRYLSTLFRDRPPKALSTSVF